MQEALVIVDVQEPFLLPEDYPNVIPKIQECVREAKAKSSRIFILEFRARGQTISEVRNLLRGYKRKHLIIKDEQSGAPGIANLVEHNSFPITHFKICGFLFDCCVRETFYGLLRCDWCHGATIIRDACDYTTPTNDFPLKQSGKSSFKAVPGLDVSKYRYNTKIQFKEKELLGIKTWSPEVPQREILLNIRPK